MISTRRYTINYVILCIKVLTITLCNIKYVEAVNCRLLSDCYVCASSMDGLLPCHWCISTRSCTNSFEALQCSEFMRVPYGYDCPFLPPNEQQYLDIFARSRALPFISAAKSDNPEQMLNCLQSNFRDVRVLSIKHVPCDPICNFCLGYLSYIPDDNALVLTFRSTNSDSQLLLEALNDLFYLQKEFQPVGGKVLAYFHDAFYALWNAGLGNEYRAAIQQYTTAETWVFGHSLGGSLASMAAAWIARMRLVSPDKLKFVSFGQPRTGDMIYAMIFDSLVQYKYRIIHKGDIITKTPFRLPFLNTASFTHHRFEVFYPNEMLLTDGYMVCTRAEDPTCSQNCMDLDHTTHLHYFNTSISLWTKQGCPRKEFGEVINQRPAIDPSYQTRPADPSYQTRPVDPSYEPILIPTDTNEISIPV